MPDSRRFRVLFDDIAWAEDLHHASAAGASAAIAARAALESSGLLADDTKPCLSEGPDGTRLSGCVKVYVPAPIGPWGLVLGLRRLEGEPVLYHLAFGARHPNHAWQLTVYQVADRRLHASRS